MAKWRKATWRGHESDDIEVAECHAHNKFVTIKTKTRVERILVKKEGMRDGIWRDQEFKKDFLVIKYPARDVNKITINALEKDKYYLVVNHTQGTANPIHKEKFDEFYFFSSYVQPVTGDSKVSDSSQAVNAENELKLRKKNKEIEKKRK